MQNKIFSLISSYKLVTLAAVVVTVSLGFYAIKTIQRRIHPTVAIKKMYVSPTPEASSSSSIQSSSISGVLSASDEVLPTDFPEDTPYPTYVPYPTFPPLVIPTLVPLPTIILPPIVINTPAPSCAGTPTAYNSQVYVSSNTSLVNSQVTISIELLDCNNSLTPVNDSLTISLVNSDPGTNINGAALPATIQAQNGKASFTVNSSNTVTDTFVVTDTSHSFTVTDPQNHNPSVTFSNNTSGSSGCSTPGGVPNGWFSDVYPASPLSVDVGSSATFSVVIRDCNKNTVGGNEALSISLSSGDSTTQVNGNNFPYSVSTQNGQVNFTIISQHAGANSFVIADTTHSFTITDPNNNNPSVVFTSQSAPLPTPTPTPIAPSPTQPIGPTVMPTPNATPTNIPSPTNTSTPSLPPPSPTPIH